jgi:hypothetical protein
VDWIAVFVSLEAAFVCTTTAFLTLPAAFVSNGETIVFTIAASGKTLAGKGGRASASHPSLPGNLARVAENLRKGENF